MSQAEIKTKLSADGSELTRALQQGISKAVDFRSQMMSIGKGIGAAFAINRVYEYLQSMGRAQIKFAEDMANLGKEADAFSKQLENLWERLGNADTVKAVNKSMLDFSQSIREVQRELTNLQKLENLEGLGGILKSMEDFAERFSRQGFGALDFNSDNKLPTFDEIRIKQLQKQLDLLNRQAEVAAQIARDKAREIEAEQRGLLERADRNRMPFSPDQIAAEIERLQNQELNLRVKFDLEPTAEARKAVEDIISERTKFEEMLGRANDAKLEEAQDFLRFVMSSQLGAVPQGQQQRFSDLRRMGANELGAGNRVVRQADPGQQALIEWAKKQFMATDQLPDKVASALQNFFGAFIR